MPFTAGQSGNPNGKRKEKLFYSALTMELKAVELDDQRGLRKIARNLIVLAESGDLPAIKEIADRLDGKPAQAIVGGDDDDNPIALVHRIERVLIDNANDSNSESIPPIIAALTV